MKTITITLYCCLILINNLQAKWIYKNRYYDHPTIFKMDSTPFLSENKYGILSIGLNYGDPNDLISDFQVPDYDKYILFSEYKYHISFFKRLSVILQKNYSNSLEYTKIFTKKEKEEYTENKNILRINCKLIREEGYLPDICIELNTHNIFSFSIGSSREKFKYYSTVNCKILPWIYIPYPYSITLGSAYEILDNANICLEYAIGSKWFLTGIDYQFNKLISSNISLFYFNVDKKDYNPYNIANLNMQKNNFLFAGRINFHLGEKNR